LLCHFVHNEIREASGEEDRDGIWNVFATDDRNAFFIPEFLDSDRIGVHDGRWRIVKVLLEGVPRDRGLGGWAMRKREKAGKFTHNTLDKIWLILALTNGFLSIGCHDIQHNDAI
jgi:hypothetical protein